SYNAEVNASRSPAKRRRADARWRSPSNGSRGGTAAGRVRLGRGRRAWDPGRAPPPSGWRRGGAKIPCARQAQIPVAARGVRAANTRRTNLPPRRCGRPQTARIRTPASPDRQNRSLPSAPRASSCGTYSPPLPTRMLTYRRPTPWQALRICVSFFKPGQCSCLNITTLGCASTILRKLWTGERRDHDAAGAGVHCNLAQFDEVCRARVRHADDDGHAAVDAAQEMARELSRLLIAEFLRFAIMPRTVSPCTPHCR